MDTLGVRGIRAKLLGNLVNVGNILSGAEHASERGCCAFVELAAHRSQESVVSIATQKRRSREVQMCHVRSGTLDLTGLIVSTTSGLASGCDVVLVEHAVGPDAPWRIPGAPAPSWRRNRLHPSIRGRDG